MGIPSYFNFVLKNHKNIIINKKHISCDYFFIDANSLIYDSFYEIKSCDELQCDIHSIQQLYNTIFQRVWEKVLGFINVLEVKKECYICFDGIPPVAKMYQQKQRRYKSFAEKQIKSHHHQNIKIDKSGNHIVLDFDTNIITPGTEFMDSLDTYISDMVSNYNEKNIGPKVLYNPSSVPGEGEHKICAYIRNLCNDAENSDFKRSNCIIYGLDADLIMLGLLLLKCHKQIFLYKETKHFSYVEHIKEDNHYYFSLMKMGLEICTTLNQSSLTQGIMDYCFLGLLCGNDFIPHTPSINLRNSGINHLISTYKYVKNSGGNRDFHMIDVTNNKVLWDKFRTYVLQLVHEENNKVKENIAWKLKLKHKMKVKDFDDKLNLLPVYDNAQEEHMNTNFSTSLYNLQILQKEAKEVDSICLNYLQVLEWNWDYYNGITQYFDISYKHCHGPLLTDILRHIPLFGSNHTYMDGATLVNPNNFHKTTLLFYVMPVKKFPDYLPQPYTTLIECVTNEFLKNIDPLDYSDFHYFLCKYFWEAKLDFEDCSVVELNDFIQSKVNEYKKNISL